ncbi:hypothetical protein F5X96DRAFT_666222 [Biscogniauxia mediterranea]|nr:hypothetical protein F5X96DRAFT_666222 [Biscogniauxia mediterranea]
MGQPSFEASNAIIYLTYGAFLLLGTGLAWKMRNQSKADFLAGNRSQKAFPLALNFIAAGIESGGTFEPARLACLPLLTSIS